MKFGLGEVCRGLLDGFDLMIINPNTNLRVSTEKRQNGRLVKISKVHSDLFFIALLANACRLSYYFQ